MGMVQDWVLVTAQASEQELEQAPALAMVTPPA